MSRRRNCLLSRLYGKTYRDRNPASPQNYFIMLGFPKDNCPIKGEFANEAKKWITAVDHYNKGIATEEEIKLIEEQIHKDKELAEKCSMWNFIYTDDPVKYFLSKKQNDNNEKN